MASYQQEVVKIEPGVSEKGPFTLVTFKLKDGSMKEKRVIGNLGKKFQKPGKYNVSYADDTHFMNDASYMGEVDSRIVKASDIPNNYEKPAPLIDRERSITVNTCIKASAEVTSAFITGKDMTTSAVGLIAEELFEVFARKAGL